MNHLWRVEYGFAGSQTMHTQYVLAPDEPCPSWLGQVLPVVKANHAETTASIEIRDVKRLGPICVMTAQVAAPPAPVVEVVAAPPPAPPQNRRR